MRNESFNNRAVVLSWCENIEKLESDQMYKINLKKKKAIWVENKSSNLAEYIAFSFNNTLHAEFDTCIFKIYIIFKRTKKQF